jgi:diadenosine tetraphosphate (Ap4A) HIT family hydrolase
MNAQAKNHQKYDDQNVFARIVRGELPSNKVYEDDHVLAFHDIAEMAPVHVLVVPKGPYTSLHDFLGNASDLEISGFWRGVYRTAEKLGIPAVGYNLFTSIGITHGQEVFHFHVHLTSGKPLPEVLNSTK